MCTKICPPVIPPLYTIEADGAVSSEQDDHVSEDVEQQSVWVQLSDRGKGVVQVGWPLIEPQLVLEEGQQRETS